MRISITFRSIKSEFDCSSLQLRQRAGEVKGRGGQENKSKQSAIGTESENSLDLSRLCLEQCVASNRERAQKMKEKKKEEKKKKPYVITSILTKQALESAAVGQGQHSLNFRYNFSVLQSSVGLNSNAFVRTSFQCSTCVG